MKHHFVLIDYQNVRPDLKAVVRRTTPVDYLIFLGAGQKKLLKKVESGSSDLKTTIITLNQEGKNALDFHITYYLGAYTKEHPEAVFDIISKDKGFDALIDHLRANGISCSRSPTLPGFLLRPEAMAANPAKDRELKAAPQPMTYSTSVNSEPSNQIPFPVWSPVFLPAV